MTENDLSDDEKEIVCFLAKHSKEGNPDEYIKPSNPIGHPRHRSENPISQAVAHYTVHREATQSERRRRLEVSP